MWQYLRRGGTPHLPMLSPSWSMEKYSNYLDTLWSSWLSTNDYPQFSFIFCSLKGCKYVDYFQRISWSGQKHFNYTLGTMSSIKTSWSFLNWNWWLKITDQNSVIIQRSSRLLWEIQTWLEIQWQRQINSSSCLVRPSVNHPNHHHRHRRHHRHHPNHHHHFLVCLPGNAAGYQILF